MLANYAKWYSFTPPQRPNFPPPLTGKLSSLYLAVDGADADTKVPRCLSPADSYNHTSPHAAAAVVHPMLANLMQVIRLAGIASFSEFLAAPFQPLRFGFGQRSHPVGFGFGFGFGFGQRCPQGCSIYPRKIWITIAG